MDGLANKSKLNSKTFLFLGIGGIIVVISLLFFIFTSQAPETDEVTQDVINKTESRTYLKYIALDASDEEEVEVPAIEPSETPSPTEVVVDVENDEATSEAIIEEIPSPTEIILAVEPTDSEAEAETESEPVRVAQLPTTGMIQGSLAIFIISFSMILFAFIL